MMRPELEKKYSLYKDGELIAVVEYQYDRWHGLCFISMDSDGEKTIWTEFDYWEAVIKEL